VTLLAIALLQEGNPWKETIMIKSRIIVTGATGKTGSGGGAATLLFPEDRIQ
jgi:hypothetical protein